MIYFKRICFLIGLFLAAASLNACSYFDTNEDVIEVTSKDLENDVVFIDENSVENVLYRDTKGAVEIYNLDVSEQEAVDNFVPFAKPKAQKDDASMELNPSVEIYPIDIPMQETLKPSL